MHKNNLNCEDFVICMLRIQDIDIDIVHNMQCSSARKIAIKVKSHESRMILLV